ncbi:hypothetical protein E4K72_10910 [Oxalobacteraceae bacterium OM1]|nr:hypothetical protein E4K72_10910 [Oxalobacteraceae bacterium OM1]
MSLPSAPRPWFLGKLALYAGSLHAAREAYERVRAMETDQLSGTIVLDSGEEVDWVNVRGGGQDT